MPETSLVRLEKRIWQSLYPTRRKLRLGIISKFWKAGICNLNHRMKRDQKWDWMDKEREAESATIESERIMYPGRCPRLRFSWLTTCTGAMRPVTKQKSAYNSSKLIGSDSTLEGGHSSWRARERAALASFLVGNYWFDDQRDGYPKSQADQWGPNQWNHHGLVKQLLPPAWKLQTGAEFAWGSHEAKCRFKECLASWSANDRSSKIPSAAKYWQIMENDMRINLCYHNCIHGSQKRRQISPKMSKWSQ